jgi:hypothetical protein
MSNEIRELLIQLLVVVAVGAFLVWCISFGVRSASKKTQKDNSPRDNVLTKRPVGYRGAKTLEMPAPPPEDRPGRFRINGVDRQTKLDTTWYVQADSVANATVKAELEGIIPTKIERA